MTVLCMANNYRSSQSIIKVAEFIIRQDGGRISKPLTSCNKTGALMTKIRCHSEIEQAKYVADEIQFQLESNAHLYLSDFAILVRQNSQVDEITKALNNFALPYAVTRTDNDIDDLVEPNQSRSCGDPEQSITITSIHRAKGQEWQCIFIVSCMRATSHTEMQ